MSYPFEFPFTEIQTDPEPFVSAVFSCLESEFLVLPKGESFIEYPAFQQAYEALRQVTAGFRDIRLQPILEASFENPLVLVVLRTMLGFTPPEWAYIATERTGVQITQHSIRSLDHRIRRHPSVPLRRSGLTALRVRALVEVASQLLNGPAPDVGPQDIHRLDKADTHGGPDSLAALASLGCPYAMLLYERYLGRPFAGHRDSVSELIGGALETSIEDILTAAHISYRKTRRAERIVGFDQAPDFIVPDEFNPQVIIEAKISEDDGTARDKVTRIQHLAEKSREGRADGSPRFEVVACIAGRGFGVRREDMKRLLLATRGKVFTPRTLDRLVQCTRLREFAAKRREP